MSVGNILGKNTFVCLECDHEWTRKDRHLWWPIGILRTMRYTVVAEAKGESAKRKPYRRPFITTFRVSAGQGLDGRNEFTRALWVWNYGLHFGPRGLAFRYRGERRCPRCKVSFYSQEHVS